MGANGGTLLSSTMDRRICPLDAAGEALLPRTIREGVGLRSPSAGNAARCAVDIRPTISRPQKQRACSSTSSRKAAFPRGPLLRTSNVDAALPLRFERWRAAARSARGHPATSCAPSVPASRPPKGGQAAVRQRFLAVAAMDLPLRAYRLALATLRQLPENADLAPRRRFLCEGRRLRLGRIFTPRFAVDRAGRAYRRVASRPAPGHSAEDRGSRTPRRVTDLTRDRPWVEVSRDAPTPRASTSSTMRARARTLEGARGLSHPFALQALFAAT